MEKSLTLNTVDCLTAFQRLLFMIDCLSLNGSHISIRFEERIAFSILDKSFKTKTN